MLIFSGTSNQPLAEKVAKKLKVPLGKMEIVRFGNSECRVRVLEDVRDKICLVFQSTSAPTDEYLMELFLIVDALKRSAATRVIAVVPYFGYARQNQQHRVGECVSAHVVAKFIEAVGVDELITIDFHEEQVAGFFEIPVRHLSGLTVLAKAIKNYIVDQHVWGDYVIVSPDQGGIERARRFVGVLGDENLLVHELASSPAARTARPLAKKMLGGSLAQTTTHSQILSSSDSLVVVEKKRDLEKMHVSEAVQVVGDVRDKVAIIVDDIITSGGTIVNAAEAVLEAGAKKVFLGATHADFIEGTVEKLEESSVEKVFVTDTISLSPEKIFPKLEVISVADIIVREIEKLF